MSTRGPAISTKRTSDLWAAVPAKDRTMGSVIPRTALITSMMVAVTNSEQMWVFQAIVLGSGQPVAIATPHTVWATYIKILATSISRAGFSCWEAWGPA